MPAVLYRRERDLLKYVWEFQEQNGYSPTLKEMADAMNRRSQSTMHSLIKSLVDKGYVQKVDGNTRTLKILKKEILPSILGNTAKTIGSSIALPLMGYIAAGQPLEPHTDSEATLHVASTMLSGKKTSYALQVKGNSMIEDGIFEGDYVVIEKSDVATDGDIVVALVDDNLATLKRYHKENGRVVLRPANAEMDPIYPRTIQIQGICVGLVRKFTNSS